MGTKKMAVYGAGKIGRKFISEHLSEIALIIDKNAANLKSISGIKVIEPGKIQNMEEYFVVIASQKYEDEIKQTLINRGGVDGINFISYRKYGTICKTINTLIKVLNHHLFQNKSEIKKIINTKKEWEIFLESQKGYSLRFIDILTDFCLNTKTNDFFIDGFCETCGSNSRFYVHYDGGNINWRESLICEKCRLSSRHRMLLGKFQKEATSEANVYINEYVTPSFQWLRKKYKKAIGSEYLSPDYICGKIYNDIRHEDATNLSFPDNSLDFYLSQDVFEHTADYEKTFKEAYRVLKEGGKLLFSIPFHQEMDEIIVRAKFNKGVLEHTLPALYHGNPISNKGSLVFTDYGWNFINFMKSLGFSNIIATADFSVDNAYFDLRSSILFTAVK